MLHTVEDISSTKKRLRIEIPSDAIENEIKDTFEKLRQKTKLPGFRTGKAPMNLIEKRFGKEVEAEVLEKVIPDFYKRALKEAELIPVTTPVFDEQFDFKRNSPLNLSFTVEVMPKVENLHYEGVKVPEIPIVVDEAEVEDSLKRLQDEKAIYEVAEKEIEMDDLVTFDYVDCEIVGEEKDPAFKDKILKIGNEVFPLDIIEKAVGKKKGDIVEFTNTFDKIFRVKELAGKTISMKVMIKEVKRKILPEIDDEFAKDIGFENMAGLKERIKENINNVKKGHAVKIQKAEILNKLIESNSFDVPEALLKNELEALLIQEMSSQGKSEDITKEEGTFKEEKKDNEELQVEMRKKALRNVQASIIVDTIGKKEGVIVTDDEVKERINMVSQRLSVKPEQVMNFYITRDGSLEGLRQLIYEDKVIDLMLSKAVFEKGE
ncbi:MAG: trigger factor [Nitrospirota bacterium]|nr:trigger factor [Nitrospirota bacterium]